MYTLIAFQNVNYKLVIDHPKKNNLKALKHLHFLKRLIKDSYVTFDKLNIIIFAFL